MNKQLYLRGHSAYDISEANRMLEDAEKKKHPDIRHVEKSMYWFTLATGVLGSMILSVASIPVLVASTPPASLPVILIFGVLLGSLIAYISRNMHWLERHHHISLMLLIPAASVFVFCIAVLRVNVFMNAVGLPGQHNPALVASAFVLGFFAPYIFLSVFRV